jgi:hypothetical protein
MDAELEKRWREAESQKNIEPDELKAMVQEVERGITIPENWNWLCEESIRKEKKEIEKKYGIRIGHTEIYCAECGKSWGTRSHISHDEPKFVFVPVDKDEFIKALRRFQKRMESGRAVNRIRRERGE